MGSQKGGQNLDFVGMSTGSRGARVRRESVATEPAVPVVPKRIKGVVPTQPLGDTTEVSAEQEQRLRERIREEVRAELKAEMSEEKKGRGLAKASPEFKTIEPKVTANDEEQDQAIENNSEEVSD